MFLSFESKEGTYAIRPFVGGVNALTGNTFVPNMATALEQLVPMNRQQDYIVVRPEKDLSQRWLDGVRTSRGKVRQFVAVPGESSLSIESQITGSNAVGGLQLEIIPRHQTCCTTFWHSVSSQDPWCFPLDATPKDLNLSPGCRVYTDTISKTCYNKSMDRRRMVTVRDIFHDAQTTASRNGDLVSEIANTSTAIYEYCPASPSFTVRMKELEHDFPVEYYFPITLPREGWSAKRFWTIGAQLLDYKPAGTCLLYEGQRLQLNDTIEGMELSEGDVIELAQDPVGGGGALEYEVDLTLGAGAEIHQKIIPDGLSPRLWHIRNSALVSIQVLDSARFQTLTGLAPPAPPMEFQTYVRKKFRFLSLPGQEDISTSTKLGQLESCSATGTEACVEDDSKPSAAETKSVDDGEALQKRKRIDGGPKLPGYCHSCGAIYTKANKCVQPFSLFSPSLLDVSLATLSSIFNTETPTD